MNTKSLTPVPIARRVPVRQFPEAASSHRKARQQEAFLRAIRQLLEDKLSHIETSTVEKRPAATKPQPDDSAALAFIRSLQAE